MGSKVEILILNLKIYYCGVKSRNINIKLKIYNCGVKSRNINIKTEIYYSGVKSRHINIKTENTETEFSNPYFKFLTFYSAVHRLIMFVEMI